MVQGVIFDFFGTLVEQGTHSPSRQTLGILRIRLPYPKFIVRFEEVFMTKPFANQAEAFQEVCAAFRVRPYPIVIDKLIGVWNKNKLLAKEYEDTFAVLKDLKKRGMKLALLANFDASTYEMMKEKFELDKHFDVILASCETGQLKTSDEMIMHTLEGLGLAKDEVVFVGDSIESDMRTAEKAGIKGILVDRKGDRNFGEKIASLSELTKKIFPDDE